MAMNPTVLGRAVRFPLRPGPDGRMAYIEGEDAVAQAIVLILATALGERQMRFRFGSELPRMLFEPISAGTLARIEDAARVALRDNERRALVVSVRAEPHPTTPSRVDVAITYETPRTSRRGNLVYPLYLQGD